MASSEGRNALTVGEYMAGLEKSLENHRKILGKNIDSSLRDKIKQVVDALEAELEDLIHRDPNEPLFKNDLTLL